MENYRFEIKILPLAESIKLVLSAIKDNEVILFSKRLHDLERKNRLGIIHNSEYQIEKNKLEDDWSQKIDLLSDEDTHKIANQLLLGASVQELGDKLYKASILLTTWPHVFQNTNGCHIPRKETDSILQWIEATLPDQVKGLSLLVGDAGYGKSVILRDVFFELKERQIPVLGIKADRYCTESITDLEKRLNLSEGIESMIRALARSNEKVVVLVDQIDALSQSLSTRRAFLDTFIHLISLLTDISNIRVVVSCRTYDLENDQALFLYGQEKKFIVGKLEEIEVRSVLQQLSDKTIDLSSSLLELLKTPLHLDVFCRIYHPNFSTEKLSVLRDLYDELWKQKITDVLPNHISARQCKMLMYRLAEDMYNQQKLEIPVKSKYADFASELKYLLSTGIIHKNQNGITFFHQTFYDYTFALQFVESKVSIEDYLKENEQCLHIRACLKMMIEFLRDRDQAEYIRLYWSILNSSDYYFHVKSLLISLLAAIKHPTRAEIQLAEEIIFPNAGFFKFFIQALNSSEWLLLLLEQGLLEGLYLPELANDADSSEKRRYSNTMSMLNRVLVRHLPECRNEILEFTWNFPNIEPKAWLVRNVLHQLEIWDSPLSFALFDQFHAENYDVFFADFLKKAISFDLSWTIKHIKKAIKEQFSYEHFQSNDEFNYYLVEIIKYGIEIYPDEIFGLLLGEQLSNLEQSTKPNLLSSQSDIISDFSWRIATFDELYDDETSLFSLLLYCIRALAKNQAPSFSNFVEINFNNNSSTILLLLVEGFRVNPTENVNNIYKFITIFLHKKGYTAQQNLAWRVRLLLKEAYSYFNESQKSQLIEAIINIGRQTDIDFLSQEVFNWLKSIPKEDIIQNIGLKSLIEELEVEFKDDDDNEPNRVHWQWIGPPMSQEDYKIMSLNSWHNSFYRYNHSMSSLDFSAGKGGSEEHVRKFYEEVKSRPDFFFPLIEDLIYDKNVSIKYLIYGLEGLKEVKYNQAKVLFLLKKINIPEIKEAYFIRRLVSICGYFISTKNNDDFFFHFLIDLAKNHPDPVSETHQIAFANDENESIFTSGLNTVRGNTIEYLLHCYYFKEHENLLFEVLESIANTDFLLVRSQLMPHLALLTNLDKARTLKLFLTLTNKNEPVIMERSPWSAKYLSWNHFEEMQHYFEQMLAYPKSHENIATILTLNWVHERNDTLKMLNRFIEQSEEAKKGVILTAMHNIWDKEGHANLRSIKLFTQFFSESIEKVQKAYQIAFRHFQLKDFEILKSALFAFKDSNVAMKTSIPFYDYISKCATKYPDDCLSLVKDYNRYEKPDINSGEYYSSAPLNVVLNAYHALWGKKKKDSAKIREALLLFDEMLQDDHLSNLAVGVLAKIVE